MKPLENLILYLFVTFAVTFFKSAALPEESVIGKQCDGIFLIIGFISLIIGCVLLKRARKKGYEFDLF